MARQRGRLSEVTIVTPVPVIRVRRRKPLIANGLQYDCRIRRFMPIVLVAREMGEWAPLSVDGGRFRSRVRCTTIPVSGWNPGRNDGSSTTVRSESGADGFAKLPDDSLDGGKQRGQGHGVG
jgi:hypothetical protein